MKRSCLVLALIITALFFACPNPAAAAAGQGFTGTAFNAAVATSSGVELFVSTKDNKQFRAKGAFDGKTLVGVFDLYGRRLPQCKEADLCLQFTGAIDLGTSGAFPRGTKTTFVLTLAISARTGTATGVYHIGPIPKVDYAQQGILNLKKKK